MSIYTQRSKQADYFDYDEYYCSDVPEINGKKAMKIREDSSKHYPNKDEAKELRKIMSSTGLTEEEVRKDKKYRKQLSDAQKSGQKLKTAEDVKFYRDLIKTACKKTGLTPQHPETLKALNEIIKERQGKSWGRRFFLYQNIKTAEKIVKEYAKK